MTKRLLIGLVALCLMALALPAHAQTATWTPSTDWISTDGATGTFTVAEQGTMIFYLRARKVGDTAERKYFGETRNGVAEWTGDLATAFATYGLATPQDGEVWEVTVSQAFRNPATGVELDSNESVAFLYSFPSPLDRAPATPGDLVVTD